MASSSTFYLPSLPNPPLPLPQVPGPKLPPFIPSAYADNIEFINFIGREKDRDSQVWKVKINNNGPYALKMFYFKTWQHLKDAPGRCLTRSLANRQLYIDYLDPFNCECRAYGRLRDEGREDLAVKAHGYLLLTPEQETALTKRILGWDSDDDSSEDKPETAPGRNAKKVWGRYEQHRDLPIRAIVKELIPGDSEAFKTALPHLWKTLEELHKLGVIVRDVHSGNYLGGKLIDFSRAFTMYHPCLHHVFPYDLEDFLRDDPEGLENTLIAYYQAHPEEPIDVLESLQNSVGGISGVNTDYGVDPRDYNWYKWEESVEEADAYVAEELFASRGGEPEEAAAGASGRRRMWT